MKTLFTLILVGYAGFTIMQDKHVRISYPGRELVLEQPLQTSTNESPFEYKGVTITPLAKFTINARVLSKKDYSDGKESTLSPIDLALGWGPMSKSEQLKHIRISQGGRWYSWYTETNIVSRKSIEENSANMHMIPANSDILTTLEKAQRNQQVEIQGFLVECSSGTWKWRSSLTRLDVGDGACEVIYVTNVRIVGNMD
jgi:hypothetical protein